MQKVLITREPHLAGRLVQRLAEHGVHGIAASVTEFAAIKHRDIQPNPNHYKGIIFSSARAVNVTADFYFSSIPTTVKGICVGPATSSAFSKRFKQEPALVGNSGGNVLANNIIDKFGPDFSPILWPSARIVSSDIVYILKSHGIVVDKWPVYETISIPRELLNYILIKIGEFNAIFVTSPSAAKSLARIDGLLKRPCVAIGKTTEKALQRYGWTDILTAETPEESSCFDAILKCLANQKNNHLPIA
jgi:uroporphyrinogen-III synthase